MYEFFSSFYPHILDIYQGELDQWETKGFQIYKKSTENPCLLYVFKGKGTMMLDEQSYSLEEGNIAQIPVSQKLILRNLPPDSLCYYMIQYDYKLVQWEGLTTRCEEPAEKQLPFEMVMAMMDPRGLRSDLQLLYQIWSEKRSGYSGQAKLLFFNLLLHISNQLYERKQDDSAEKSIMDCVNYINNHYHESMEREMLARKVSISKSYFSILFKKYVGCSPVQYITRVRVDKAMQLLRKSNKPVSVVAMEVGYQDPLYFSRVFTREVGMTPRAYRDA